MVFQESGECSPAPFKCLHLISDDIYQSLIGKSGCEDRCGESSRGVVDTGTSNHIENNYYAPDDGPQRGNPPAPPPPHPSDNDLEKTIHSPPPPPPPDPPTDPTPPDPGNPLPPSPDTISPPPISEELEDVNNKPENDSRDGRGKIRKDKTGIRRVPYKTRIKRRRKKKDSQNFPLSSYENTAGGANEEDPALSHPGVQETTQSPSVDPSPKKVAKGVTKPEAKREEKKLKIKDGQMRVMETTDMSSDDEVTETRVRSPSPQSLLPRPTLKMLPSRISLGKDKVKPTKSDDKPKLKKINPDPGWISLYDEMDEDLPVEEPAHESEMIDLTNERQIADFEFKRGERGMETSSQRGKGAGKKFIHVRKDLFQKRGEGGQPRKKAMSAPLLKRDNVKKLKVKPRLRVRGDLYDGGSARADINEENIHSRINVRDDIFKKKSSSSRDKNERNIHSRINVRRDLFKRKPESSIPSRMERAEIRSENAQHSPELDVSEGSRSVLDDSIEYIDVPDIPLFPPPINYNVKSEKDGKPKVRRGKLIAKRAGHGTKSVTLLGKRRSGLMGKKIPPKILKLSVGEKRKAGTVDVTDKKQKKKHQSFIKLWEISKME